MLEASRRSLGTMMLAASSFFAAADARANFQETGKAEANQPPAAVSSTLESPLAALSLPVLPVEESSAAAAASEARAAQEVEPPVAKVGAEAAQSAVTQPQGNLRQQEASVPPAQQSGVSTAPLFEPTMFEQMVTLGVGLYLIYRVFPRSAKQATQSEESSTPDSQPKEKATPKKEAAQKQSAQKENASVAATEANSAPKPWPKPCEEYVRRYHVA